MAAREQSGQNIEPGVIQRVSAGLRYMISGVGPDNWFGPQQPLRPQAQDDVEGRAFDYPVGYNLRIQPREGEAISFAQLRALADGYDLLRLVIETRKDQIEAFDWEIVPHDAKVSADTMRDEIRRCTDFLQSPDKEHVWPQWLRMQIEDLLVIDTIAVYPRATRGGDLYALELVDGATIKRVLDDTGRTPLPPSPAYQQVLKGIPAADYTREQLIYTMRNPRTSRVYGMSPVEQVLMTVNIALRRQMSQLQFYTEGNVPEALAQVPENWTAKQISEFQTWWDGVHEGNIAAKRKMRFIPSLKDIVFPKKEVLKDEYDEWLARIICFAFSISPSALIKQVNRASGEQMADTAKEEGLMPLLKFLQEHMTLLVQRYIGCPGLRFRFKIVNRVAPADQATIHGTYIDKNVLTPDEVREELGLDAMTDEQRETAWPTPTAPVMLGPDGAPIAPDDGAQLPPGAGGTKTPPPGTKAPKGETTPDDDEAKRPPVETPAEKMLATALSMLDPARVAAIARDLAPNVVEVRPDVQVEVGDVNVHVPRPPAPVIEKRAPGEDQQLVTRTMADGTRVARWEPRP